MDDMPDALPASELPFRTRKEIANFIAGYYEALDMADIYRESGSLSDAARKEDDAKWYFAKAVERGYRGEP